LMRHWLPAESAGLRTVPQGGRHAPQLRGFGLDCTPHAARREVAISNGGVRAAARSQERKLFQGRPYHPQLRSTIPVAVSRTPHYPNMLIGLDFMPLIGPAAMPPLTLRIVSGGARRWFKMRVATAAMQRQPRTIMAASRLRPASIRRFSGSPSSLVDRWHGSSSNRPLLPTITKAIAQARRWHLAPASPYREAPQCRRYIVDTYTPRTIVSTGYIHEL
jgi:hypothetical protein